MSDRENTPPRGTPGSLLASPAVEATTGNGRDHRRETTTARPETREEQIDRAILEGVAERQHINGKLSEHDRRFDRLDADLDILVDAQRRSSLASSATVPPMRPPLPSVTDDELEVSEHTLNGQTPIYRISSTQLQALRETDQRHALQSFAVGEAERFQVAINRDREEQRLRAAAAPILFVRGKALPAILVAACVGAATLWWNRIVALLHSH